MKMSPTGAGRPGVFGSQAITRGWDPARIAFQISNDTQADEPGAVVQFGCTVTVPPARALKFVAKVEFWNAVTGKNRGAPATCTTPMSIPFASGAPARRSVIILS